MWCLRNGAVARILALPSKDLESPLIFWLVKIGQEAWPLAKAKTQRMVMMFSFNSCSGSQEVITIPWSHASHPRFYYRTFAQPKFKLTSVLLQSNVHEYVNSCLSPRDRWKFFQCSWICQQLSFTKRRTKMFPQQPSSLFSLLHLYPPSLSLLFTLVMFLQSLNKYRLSQRKNTPTNAPTLSLSHPPSLSLPCLTLLFGREKKSSDGSVGRVKEKQC